MNVLEIVPAVVTLVLLCACASCGPTGGEQDWLRERAEMVKLLGDFYKVGDQRVLAAMGRVRRHMFIPEAFRNRSYAYADHALPIGYDQTISQPYIVAYMTERLALKEGEKVLEIGTGSGYQAAVLAELGADVWSIEIIPELAEHARGALAAQGYTNVHVLTGDGYKGWPEHAPYDAIIVTCAPEDVPDALVRQLAEGGRMILPVGVDLQRLVILRKTGGKIGIEQDLQVRFVPMVREGKAAR